MAPSSEQPLGGGCLCGAVRYALTAPFRRANVCHCTRCQKHSGGAASVQGRVPRDGFRLLQGADALRVFRPEGGMVKVFCTTCGSSVFGGTWPDGPEISVRLGTVDGDPGLRPSFHQWAAEAPAWDPFPEDGLPRFAAAPPA